MVRSGAVTGEGIVHELLGIPAEHVTVGPEALLESGLSLFPRGAGIQAKRRVRAADSFGITTGGVRNIAASSDWRKRPSAAGPAISFRRRFLAPAAHLGNLRSRAMEGLPVRNLVLRGEWEPDRQLEVFMDRRPVLAGTVLSPPAGYRSRPRRQITCGRSTANRPADLDARAGFAGAKTEDLMFRGIMPQDWLFEKAGCVIHHGGIGNCGASPSQWYPDARRATLAGSAF
jgi:hypothetical protein